MMNGFIGNFFISPDLEVDTVRCDAKKYQEYTRRSIYLALSWIQANILSSSTRCSLKKKILNNFKFSYQNNIFLINFCLEYRKKLTIEAPILKKTIKLSQINTKKLYITSIGENGYLIMLPLRHDCPSGAHFDLIPIDEVDVTN